MFGFGKPKKVTEDFVAIADGQLMPITDVKDQVFSQKMMGDGYAIEPSSGTIVAPTDSTINSIADTKHAVMLTTKDGLELILHLGLDTVELKGAPFHVLVKAGQTVKSGDPLVKMQLDEVRQAGKETTVMVVVTNMQQVVDLTVQTPQTVDAGTKVMSVSVKL